MDWENLRHFAALAQAGSLSAAARLLRVEHATIARRVAALEAGLDLKLVDRRGRRLSLTPDGERIAAIAARMEGDARAVGRFAEGARSELAGDVRISTPPAFAAAMLAGPLVALRRRHPHLVLHVAGEKRLVSLERREADLAIRFSRPERGDLTVLRLGEVAFRLYASPSYLAAMSPAGWSFVGFGEDMDEAPQQRALLRHAAGRPIATRASTVEIQRAIVRAGGGVAVLPDFMAAGDPGLVPALPEETPVTRGVWLVVHSDLRNAPAIRAVMDCLRDELGPSLRGSAPAIA